MTIEEYTEIFGNKPIKVGKKFGHIVISPVPTIDNDYVVYLLDVETNAVMAQSRLKSEIEYKDIGNLRAVYEELKEQAKVGGKV